MSTRPFTAAPDEIDDFLDKSDDDAEVNASSQDTQDAEGEEDTEMPEAPPAREPSPELQPPAKKQKLPKFQKNKGKSSSKNDSIELVVEDAAKTVDAMETGVTGPHTQQHDGIGIEVVQLARLIYQAVSVNTHSTKQIRYEELMQEEERLNSAVVLSVQRLGFGVEEFLAALSPHSYPQPARQHELRPSEPPFRRHLLFVTDYPLIEISVRDLITVFPRSSFRRSWRTATIAFARSPSSKSSAHAYWPQEVQFQQAQLDAPVRPQIVSSKSGYPSASDPFFTSLSLLPLFTHAQL
ncbi:hypothetical protein HMN09_01348600 [Mycena chlorophos]|uniref:Uncharacterized protein n=1 Tax=Mycena chlorophos TaxID=658473 RepID=A0A8H6VQ34_MYCCL|nr:hypothetical protein HMN09_01348600 [Mycena chlorophos]